MEEFNYNLTFIYGPKVDVHGTHSNKYCVEFYEKFGEDWALVHNEHRVDPYSWYSHARKFRTKWRIKIWGWRDKPVLLADHIYDENDRRVYLHFESSRFDVNLNWFMKAKKFAFDFGAHLVIETRFKERLQKHLPAGCNITLLDRMESKEDRDQYLYENNIYAMYYIGRKDIQSKAYNWWESDGIFENHGRHHKSYDHPVDWVSIPDEQLFESILGL